MAGPPPSSGKIVPPGTGGGAKNVTISSGPPPSSGQPQQLPLKSALRTTTASLAQKSGTAGSAAPFTAGSTRTTSPKTKSVLLDDNPFALDPEAEKRKKKEVKPFIF